MEAKADSPAGYLEQPPEERKLVVEKLREIILKNLPVGFQEQIIMGC